MSYREKRDHRRGLTNPRAPWRRAARPLAVLFALQLSGIGCAARTADIPAPTKPAELEPYLTVYEDQLEGAGISLRAATAYVTGRERSLVAEPGTNGGPYAGDPEIARFRADTVAAGQTDNETFRLVEGVPEYIIGPADVIQVTTFLGPETPTTSSYRVQADGTVFVPRFDIGSVVVAGTTPSELTRELSNLYRRYVPAGYAEVRIEEHNAWKALLTGEIVDVIGDGPGRYPLDGRVTVGDFIYAHGGPTADAALSDVRILRAGAEIPVDVAGVLAGRSPDVPLRAGDIVSVPSIRQGESVILVLGEVSNPGIYPHSVGTSVIDVIAQAGGWTATARRDAAYIARGGSNEVIPVDLDLTLGTGQIATAPEVQPGDVVVVPFIPDRSQRIRDWVGIFGLILSALTIIELVRRD